MNSDLQKLRPLAVNKWIFGSLIKHLIFSLILGKWADLKQDMELFTKIVSWVGMFRMIPVLFSLPLEYINRLAKRLLGKHKDSGYLYK